MDMNSVLAQIFKQAHPEMSDDEIQRQISGASDQTKTDLGTQLGMNDSAMSMTPPQSANTSPSSFDVKTSDTTIPMNGNLPMAQVAAPAAVLPPAPEETTPVQTAPEPISITPTPEKVTPASTAEVPKTKVPDISNQILPSDDVEQRAAAMADASKKRKLSIIPEALAGAGDAIGTGLAAFGIKTPTDKQDKLMELAKKNFDESKGLIEEKISNDPNSDASKTARSLVLQIAPSMANDPNFRTMSDKMLRDKLPLVDTMMKAKASEDARKLGLEQTKVMRDLNVGLRTDQQQDKLEQNAKQMVSNLRGDKSLARAEEQRDGAIVAYNRLKEIQASGKEPNPVDYVDILGQIYKARTGVAPGEQILKDIRQATAKGSFDKAYTYVTGQQAPATTKDISNSLLNMAQSMGNQADKFHQGYMNAHLIKPHGLDDERWQPILKTERGMSFVEATKQNSQPTKASDPMGLR
jgi:hypothetical protein